MFLMFHKFCYTYFRFFHSLSIHGMENIPSNGRLIVVSNHPTFYDPLLVHMAIKTRKIHFLAWYTLFEVPLFNHALYASGAIPVSYDSSVIFKAFRKSLKLLQKEEVLGVFPEGGRTDLEEGIILNDFQYGALKLAYLTGAPIIPAVITGAQKLWPKVNKFPKPGKINISFYPAIQVPKLSSREITENHIEKLNLKIRNIMLEDLK